jgi:glycosyltransferase involved in cell wall biosynthesis
VPEKTKLLYLIGQYPAINHGYLLAEIRQLRGLGFQVHVASISLPDRPPEELTGEEREESARTYYVKSVPRIKVLIENIGAFLQHPVCYLGGLVFTLRLAGFSPRRAIYHLAYFFEAILVGRHMQRLGISHVHTNFSATVSLIAARVFPVTMSFVVHGFGEWYNPAESHLAERVRGALFVRSISRYGCSQLMLASDRSQWEKLLYSPLGIDSTEFVPAPSPANGSPPIILCVGRLAPEKAQAVLLEGIAALHAEGRRVRLRFVGDGPDRAWLEQRADQLGISSHVEFTGWADRTRLKALYAESDVFVLPSLAEGIPVVLMEAMAMQIPCVAPCITGIPELIAHGVDGMLFTVADVEDLTAQVRVLLDSPDLRLKIGQQARARVLRDYDMAHNTQRFAVELTKRLGSTAGAD